MGHWETVTILTSKLKATENSPYLQHTKASKLTHRNRSVILKGTFTSSICSHKTIESF